MTQRHNYWSIGEVLSLLQDEFPEVTISKIRFLESQGLIDPERTPSGYRRFYQSDFDRLQWILTQQRDHYLPLKVIRDRLDAGEEPFLTDEAARQSAERNAERLADAGQMDGQMNLLAEVIDIRGADTPAAVNEPSPSVVAASPVESRVLETSVDTSEVDESIAAPVDPSGAASADPNTNISEGDSTASEADTDTDSDADTVPTPAVSPSATEAVNPQSVAATTQEPAVATEPQRAARPTPVGMADVDPNLALTLDELAEASGCDVAMIRELERFNLVMGRTVGPTVLYDGEALMIARHAAQFRSFGLDPRHLRTFRVGAEREVALLAQVVEPLRHRRDPETRRKSVETMEDLTDLAASLRAVLMRQITRDQLPPT